VGSDTPFVIAHVSDFHTSDFGDTIHDMRRAVKRSARVADIDPSRWEVYWQESGWRVLHKKGARRAKIQLVDPAGYSHPLPAKKDNLKDPVDRAAQHACRLEARRARSLSGLSPGAVDILAESTPENVNVRLVRAARSIDDAVDAVVMTGDLTDDGEGYEVISTAFERFRGRLFAVPGNHDRYLFPIASSARPRPSHEQKAERWRAFAKELGLDLDPCGAWMRAFPDRRVVLVGLDSCARGQRRFFRHNGALGAAQLDWLRGVAKTDAWKDARHRVVALHHHVVPLPHGVGKRAPSEIGMRLDDAKAAAECFDDIGVTAVLHGHRHVSEERRPAGSRFTIFAAPSFTLGCKSGDAPSYWRIELADRLTAERVYVGAPAVVGEDADDALESSADPSVLAESGDASSDEDE
jgi:3',5'-cyclic AMP phosphodiesterase CpdA